MPETPRLACDRCSSELKPKFGQIDIRLQHVGITSAQELKVISRKLCGACLGEVTKEIDHLLASRPGQDR